MLLKGRLKPSIQQGASRVLVALLPDSFDVIEEMLSLNTPRGVHDVHFTVFASLEQSDFNYTEQAGIEYLLVNYLMKARSSACYSAWKAGLTLADAWHSTRSEARLVELLFSAHYSAGRLGALNGCEHILKHRQTLTPQDLAPLLSVARNDPSERVRKTAQFILEYRLGVKPRAKRENR
jgi:hypothetical protein